jgi:hypothetical protein
VAKQTNDERPTDDVTEQELDAANAEPLPDRQALSVIRGFETLPQPIVPEPPLDSE